MVERAPSAKWFRRIHLGVFPYLIKPAVSGMHDYLMHNLISNHSMSMFSISPNLTLTDKLASLLSYALHICSSICHLQNSCLEANKIEILSFVLGTDE